MRNLPRTTIATAAALGVLASSLLFAAPAGAAKNPTPAPSSTPVVGSPPGLPTVTSVSGGAATGQLVVTYTAPISAGSTPITDYEVSVDGGLTWWPCGSIAGTCTLTNLSDGRAYSVSLRAVNAAGSGAVSAPVAGTPSTPPGIDPDKPAKLPKPRVWVNASFDASSNHLGVVDPRVKLGVGTLPELKFSRSIPDKSVVERHLAVKATLDDGRVRKVKGAWGWLDDRTAVFRPMKYWPGRSTIDIVSTLDRAVMGKSGRTSVIGSDTLGTTYSFRTARSFIAKVDGSTDKMRVFVDGKKVKTFGVSLGKKDWETRYGVKVISVLKEPKHTYTSVSLNLDPSVEEPYELKDIPWNTRLTPTGEFIHSAPWAYGRIGRYNGSHGCTNMFENDAKWIYDKTIPGDVVLYENTGGESVQSWNGPGGLWNIPWDKWLKKSALGNITGQIDTSDATAGSGGSTASA